MAEIDDWPPIAVKTAFKTATATGCSDSSYFAGGYSYNAPGKLLGFTYGNGVGAPFTYTPSRTQLSTLKYTKGSSTYFSLQYWYQQNSSNCPKGSAADNGSIQCITDLVQTGRTVSYASDLMGRMTSAGTSGSTAYPQWGRVESYDRFGNRGSQTGTSGSVPQPQLVFGTNGTNSSTTNQPNGYTYEASGNMTVEQLSTPNNVTYDGVNRMTAFSGGGGVASYTYDGNGLRVVKAVSGGTKTVSIFAGSSVIAEYDNGAAPTAPSREYIYNPAGGETTGLLAMISGGATTYYHQDHLSARLATNASGSILTQDGTFPFGEKWYQSGSGNNWFFTSYDRDSESGLDYAMARYYNSRTGTFCSADPLAGSPEDPQSWNRYPYGRNDPIDKSDPSGKFFELLLPLLAEFIPQVTATIPTVVTTITVTATVTSIAAETAAVGAQIAAVALAATPDAQAPQHIQDAKKQAAKNKFNKKRCKGDLNALGTRPANLQKGIANANIMNGVGSKALRSSLYAKSAAYASAIAQFGGQTIGQALIPAPGAGTQTAAFAELGGKVPGRNIYINPSLLPTTDYWGNQATIAHEVIHNITGHGDDAIQDALGLQHGPSVNISNKLKADCF